MVKPQHETASQSQMFTLAVVSWQLRKFRCRRPPCRRLL